MRRHGLSILILAATPLGCVGAIDGMSAVGDPEVAAQPSSPTAKGLPPAGSTSTPSTPGMGSPPGPQTGAVTPPSVVATPAPGACGANVASRLPPTRVWRLSPEQYVNTVAAVFKTALPIGTVTGDGKSDVVQQPRGFDADAEQNRVYDALGLAYKSNAETVASDVVSKLAGTLACVKGPGAPPACVDEFVKTHAEPAFRRPLAAAELGRYRDFYAASAARFPPADAARMVLEAVLQSPSFLYRTELGAEGAARGQPVKLTQHELAAELSYLVADMPPAAFPELAAAAREGRLDNLQVVRDLAGKLVRTAQARAKLKGFFGYFLPSYRDFVAAEPGVSKDPAKFPTFASLKSAMVKETSIYFDKLLETDPSLKTLFTSESSYVNGALAGHYGMTGIARTATDFTQAKIPNRAGLLTHAGVLAALSQVASTSPVHRGLFFYQTLLCNVPGEADPDVTTQLERLRDAADPQATERQKYDYFVRNEQAVCAVCHSRFQPLGLSLERFDPIGRHRTQENGRPIDPSVRLAEDVAGADAAGTYEDGLAALRKILDGGRVRECFTQKYMSYAFGLDAAEQGDSCAITRVAQRFGAAGLNLNELVVELTQESSFFFRQAPR